MIIEILTELEKVLNNSEKINNKYYKLLGENYVFAFHKGNGGEIVINAFKQGLHVFNYRETEKKEEFTLILDKKIFLNDIKKEVEYSNKLKVFDFFKAGCNEKRNFKKRNIKFFNI